MRRALLVLIAAALLIAAAPAYATTIWAVGDGGVAGPEDDDLGAFLATRPMDKFVYLGDVYEDGTAAEFAQNYNPAFGRFKAITAPTPGNHEWDNRAQGYDPYWGPGVRQPNGGYYYSFDIAGWHVISLNSEEPAGTGSAQYAWLKADLSQYPGTCTIAFWHRPRFSAGPQFNTTAVSALWSALVKHATVVLSGHAHNYQRLYPVNGLTQFIVGTGGASPSGADRGDPRVASAAGPIVGALRMDLGLGTATYQFDAIDGSRIDGGKLDCVPHDPTPARIRITRPRSRARYRRLTTFNGRATNARTVRLTLVRRNGDSCRAFDGLGFVPASCGTRLSFPATGTPARWDYAFKRTLTNGSYRLTVNVRALDLTVGRRTVKFKVARPRPRQ